MGQITTIAKKAATITVLALIGIYILRRVPVASGLVDTALKG